MDIKKIYLTENLSKKSSNEDGFIHVNISSDVRHLPLSSMVGTVNAYDEYFNEKDNSDIYRLIFTINPICTNILFNANTEIVYNEGADDCMFLSRENINSGFLNIPEVSRYRSYKSLGGNSNFVRDDAIKDTGYSHPEAGNLTYHCGVDIFNNHTLRRKEFSIVSPMKGGTTTYRAFNTIEDKIRDADGETVTEKILKINDTSNGAYGAYSNTLSQNVTDLHLYTYDNIRSFKRSINDNLIESDGWVGFLNPTTINIQNYYDYAINKCMNANKSGEQIDMYPDRTLYSFIPKVNRVRGRIEKNWDYCLTYPYKNYYNDIVQNGVVNGIKCSIIEELNDTSFGTGKTENDVIHLRSQIKHNLSEGSFINITIINTAGYENYSSDFPIKVLGLGDNGEDKEHIFAVNLSDIFAVASKLNSLSYLDADGHFSPRYEIRMRKYELGTDCKYYFRKFKRLPNFKNTAVYADDCVTDDEINDNCETDFGNTINKLAFSENIYADRIAQIIFDDDIVTTGIKDNLGRPLSEIYLTIVKRNAGWREWYNDKDYGNEKVEFSHCFGKVTSGLDLGVEENAYNVHKLHNIQNPASLHIQRAVSPLEDDIKIEGFTESGQGDKGLFLGDIVEFSPSRVQETTIETVYHRFNTAQRETDSSEFSGITYQEIEADDYDITSNFTVSSYTLNGNGKIHLMPEGYYYQPHYKLTIKEYADMVNQGSHRKMVFSELGSKGGNRYSGVTSVPYYLNAGDEIHLYHKKKLTKRIGKITGVSGKTFSEIEFEVVLGLNESISEYMIFKLNPEMPETACELEDGSGRYLWRDILSSRDMIVGDELYDSVFTNGAHYFYSNINFYLKRQDPYGDYGLNTKATLDYLTGAAEGEMKDITDAEFISEDNGTVC